MATNNCDLTSQFNKNLNN